MKTKQLTRPLEIKAVDDAGTFEGYGSVFGTVDSYRDVVLPGAFEKSLEEHRERGSMPALLWQHDAREPIGTYTEMHEDKRGLFVKGQLLIGQSVPNADKAHALLRAGAVKGLSIGFNVPKGGEEFDEERNVWEIKEVDLWETSIVTFPANRDAQVTEVRADYIYNMDDTEFEQFLRDAGMSRRQAKALMADGFSGLSRRDAGAEGDVDLSAIHSFTNLMRGTTP